MTTFLKYAAFILLAASIIFATVGVYERFVAERYETGRCELWQDEADKYPKYFILEWQDELCQSRGIYINTEVRGNGGNTIIRERNE